ncbi:MAG: adenosylcobinamide-GDP ribazoletransferase [Atopobiaceae bacterium]|jgi:adenosylcobinamide-GDP ribazoletransferase
MRVIRSFVVAFSCFSKIPMPKVMWDDKSMSYALCFFPWIGLVIAILMYAWVLLAGELGFGQGLVAAVITLLPLAVTGGIHLDGFADVIDAQSSHAEPERKRAILKDPHTGAFAIMGIASYLLVYYALAQEFLLRATSIEAWLMFAGIFWLSRTLSGCSVLAFPKSSHEGMLAQFNEGADRRALGVLLVEAAAGMIFLIAMKPQVGAAMVAVALAIFAWTYRFSRTAFGGMSGDIAGYFLEMTELGMLAALAILL